MRLWVSMTRVKSVDGGNNAPESQEMINVLMTGKSSTAVVGGITVRYIDSSTSKGTGTTNCLVYVTHNVTLNRRQVAGRRRRRGFQ